MMDKKNAHRDRYHPRDQRPKNDSSEAMPPKHPAKAPPQKPKIFNSMFLHDPTCLPGRHGGQVKKSNGVGPGNKKQNKEERRAQKRARNRAAHLLALEDATTESVDGKKPEEQVRIHREPETSTSHLEDHVELPGECGTITTHHEDQVELHGEPVTSISQLEDQVELHGEPGTSTSHLEDNVELPGEAGTSTSHLEDHVELPGEPETSNSHLEDHVELHCEPGTSTSHLEDHVKLPGEPETSTSHLEDHVELPIEPETSTSHFEDHVNLPGEPGTSTSHLEDHVELPGEDGTSTQELIQLSSSLFQVPEDQKSPQTQWELLIQELEDQQSQWKTTFLSHQHETYSVLDQQKKDIDVLKESLVQVQQTLKDQQSRWQKDWDGFMETQEENSKMINLLHTALMDKEDHRPKKKNFFQRLIKNVTKRWQKMKNSF